MPPIESAAMKKLAMNPLIKTLLAAAATSVLLAACGNFRLQSPEEMGKVVVDTVYQQQHRQQCAVGTDAVARLRCQREAEKQMQQYRTEQKNQQKTDHE